MKNLTFVILFLLSVQLQAQDVSLALQKKPDLSNASAQWHAVKNKFNVSFASSNSRYAQELPPNIKTANEWQVTAWRGEKVNTQILLWSKEDISKIKINVSDLEDRNGNIIKKEDITTGIIKYVITDEFKKGCGKRVAKDFDSSYVADLIDDKFKNFNISKNNTQPLWLSINVPQNSQKGIYKGKIIINADKRYKLDITLTVNPNVLPHHSKWSYDLDLWQHPTAIARVHNVALWSKDHYKLMKPYYTMLASAGQKIVTATIVDEAWGHQTYDDFPSLIKWTKKKDGSWLYDYKLFDEYVKFVMKCGIKERINCYSMVPWKINFPYFDENTGKVEFFTHAIGTPEYNTFWKTMLVDFTKHLKFKKWFDITYIAMDERAMKDMIAVIKLLKEVDPKWKIALAGDYHPEIEKDVDYYCISSKFQFTEDVLKRRKQEGKISTWYTCCVEAYPNGFTFSSPAEYGWDGTLQIKKWMAIYVGPIIAGQKIH